MEKYSLCFALVFFFFFFTSCVGAEDQVTLPGQPPVNFLQYSGFVPVNEEGSKQLFYWFIEAPTAHCEQKPLILWLNGGPGCSSVAFGSFEEIGPFRVQNNGMLSLSSYPWNTEANMLFVESPVGVGFSFSTADDHLLGDKSTAHDMYAFLMCWFELFPLYKNREFYLAGESYAGHYIPQLAQLIMKKKDGPEPIINLKGFLLGNPVLDSRSDYLGQSEYWWSHGLISDQVREQLKKCASHSFFKPKSVQRVIALAGARYEMARFAEFSVAHLSGINRSRFTYLGVQVGGWSQEYEGLTLVTVLGAGHEVPVLRPAQAFFMFKHFLLGQPLPDSPS